MSKTTLMPFSGITMLVATPATDLQGGGERRRCTPWARQLKALRAEPRAHRSGHAQLSHLMWTVTPHSASLCTSVARMSIQAT